MQRQAERNQALLYLVYSCHPLLQIVIMRADYAASKKGAPPKEALEIYIVRFTRGIYPHLERIFQMTSSLGRALTRAISARMIERSWSTAHPI